MKRLMFIYIICIFFLFGCREKPHYNGYIDADLTYLSSDFSGRITSLQVKRGDFVKKEKLLFTVEQTSEKISKRHEAYTRKNLHAQKKSALDQIRYYEANYKRTLTMRQQNAASQNDLDLAKEQLDMAKDQLEGINFQIKASKMVSANWMWQIGRKQNVAIQDGIIYDTYFTLGEFVSNGQPILSLITEQNIKIIFFVPEEALSSLKIGQKLRAVTNKNVSLTSGEISYISNEAQYTNPILYSREEREKLVYRVEARLQHPALKSLHLGQPVTIEFVA